MRVCLSTVISLSLLVAAAGCAPLAQPAGTSDAVQPVRNTFAWVGAYRGVLPCADCRGIETVVSLNADGTYISSSRYLGRHSGGSNDRGTFEWDRSGSTISLSGAERARYKVDSERLTRLAHDGSPLAGAHAEHYLLTKIEGIVGKYWKQLELRGEPVASSDQEPHLILHADGRRITRFSAVTASPDNIRSTLLHRASASANWR